MSSQNRLENAKEAFNSPLLFFISKWRKTEMFWPQHPRSQGAGAETRVESRTKTFNPRFFPPVVTGIQHALTWAVRPMLCTVLNILTQYPLRPFQALYIDIIDITPFYFRHSTRSSPACSPTTGSSSTRSRRQVLLAEHRDRVQQLSH